MIEQVRATMVDTDALWKGIEACVYDLPHKVEWQEGSRTESVMHTMFVIPHDVVVLFANSFDLYGRCESVAKLRGCKFFKANDGSYVFRKA
jgi:hypothetical protein